MNRVTAASKAPPLTGDDAFLLALVQSGDDQAMSALFSRHSRIVYSIALRVLSDPTSADDVVHEIFMQIWRNPDGFFVAKGSLGGWLAVLARNRALDALHRRRPANIIDDIALTSPANFTSEAEGNTFMERARKVVQQLPSEERKTLEMAFFDGLKHTEIAEMTGETPDIVKTRIRNALLHLREEFQP
jgi:RNA polymerase sigma-70 factor (ECF subfamily)